MVGFFPGFRMPYHTVNTIASRVWKPYGLENVTTTSNGFIIFRFTTEEQMHVILEKGPWMFGGKNIVLQQWHPRMQFDRTKIFLAQRAARGSRNPEKIGLDIWKF